MGRPTLTGPTVNDMLASPTLMIPMKAEAWIMSTDLASLHDQLQQLNDRQAVADLITRLGLMLDDKRFDDARTILADDVVVHTPGGSSPGPEAVVAQARRNHTVRTQHVITDVLIQLEGDRAEASANLIVTFVADSDHPDARVTDRRLRSNAVARDDRRALPLRSGARRGRLAPHEYRGGTSVEHHAARPRRAGQRRSIAASRRPRHRHSSTDPQPRGKYAPAAA